VVVVVVVLAAVVVVVVLGWTGKGFRCCSQAATGSDKILASVDFLEEIFSIEDMVFVVFRDGRESKVVEC